MNTLQVLTALFLLIVFLTFVCQADDMAKDVISHGIVVREGVSLAPQKDHQVFSSACLPEEFVSVLLPPRELLLRGATLGRETARSTDGRRAAWRAARCPAKRATPAKRISTPLEWRVVTWASDPGSKFSTFYGVPQNQDATNVALLALLVAHANSPERSKQPMDLCQVCWGGDGKGYVQERPTAHAERKSELLPP